MVTNIYIKANSDELNEAISHGDIKSIEQHIANGFSHEESLRIAIKYSVWDSFKWILDNQTTRQDVEKTLSLSQELFWYFTGYSKDIVFLERLLSLPLSVIKPVKQPILNLLANCEFKLLNELLNSDICRPVIGDIKLDMYYGRLLKNISNSKEDFGTENFNCGVDLLLNSLDHLPYDLSSLVTYKKYDDTRQLVDKILLKDNLFNQLYQPQTTVKNKIKI